MTLPIKLETLDLLQGSAKQEAILVLLNKRPPAKWIKKNNGVSYLPKQRYEELLRKFFKAYRFEVITISQAANAMTVHGRLYVTWFDGTIHTFDGVGAKNLQVNAGANPADIMAIKHNAVELALPIAKTFAFKNACKDIGEIFRTTKDDDYIEYQADTDLLSTAIEAAKHFDND
jgi:hypothetical protein